MAAPNPVTFTDQSYSLDAGQQYAPSAAGRDITAIAGRGYTTELLEMDVRNFDPTDEIDMYIEYSTDNWQTVIPGGGCVCFGGSHINKDGSQGIFIRTQFSLPTGGASLRERVNVTVPHAGTVGPILFKLT